MARARGLLLSLAVALLALFAAIPAWAQAPDVEVWTHPDCTHCRAAHAFLDDLRARRPEIVVVEHDVSTDDAALEDLRRRSNEAGLPNVGLPTFSVRGKLRVGFDAADTTGPTIEALIERPESGVSAQPEGAPEDGAVCVPESCAPDSNPGANPSRRTWLQGIDMTDLVTFVLFIGIWLALQTWVLPKLGVPT